MATWEFGCVLVSVAGSPPEHDTYPIGGRFGQPPVLLVFEVPAGRKLAAAKGFVEREIARLRQQGWQPYEHRIGAERASLIFRRPVQDQGAW